MNVRELNRAFLARQMLLARAPLSPLEALKRLFALQAQQLRPPSLALWARLSGFERRLMDELLTGRRAVRATMWRATLHIATAEDYLAFRHTMQPALTASMQSILKARGANLQTDAVAAAAEECFHKKPCTFEEVRDALAAKFPGVDERAMGYLARTSLPLVMVPGESESTFTLASAWLKKKVAAKERREEFVLRYLAAFGPATAADAQTWSGLGQLKPVFESLRPRLAAFRCGKRELFDLPDAPRPPADTAAPARLLPGFDNVLLGHADRTRIIAEEHRPRVTTKNLQTPPIFLVDGFAAGTWSLTQTRTRAVVRLDPFQPLSARELESVEAEAAEMLRFAAPGVSRAEVQIGG